MKNYSSIHSHQDEGRGGELFAETGKSMIESKPLMSDSYDDTAAATLPVNAPAHRRYPSPPQIVPIKRLGAGYCRTSSHASEGRPPRSPDRSIILNLDESNTPSVFVRNLDDYRNQKFPAEILARIERENNNNLGQSKVLTNEDFRSLLGVGRLNVDIIVSLTSHEDKERLVHK